MSRLADIPSAISFISGAAASHVGAQHPYLSLVLFVTGTLRRELIRSIRDQILLLAVLPYDHLLAKCTVKWRLNFTILRHVFCNATAMEDRWYRYNPLVCVFRLPRPSGLSQTELCQSRFKSFDRKQCVRAQYLAEKKYNERDAFRRNIIL